MADSKSASPDSLLSVTLSRAKYPKLAPSLHMPQTEMVTILVGPEKEKFVLHKEFLTFHSPYFAKCLLEGTWVESGTQVVELDHTTPEAFGLVARSIYTKDIEQFFADKYLKPKEGKEKVDYALLRAKDLIDLWILADYLQMPELQNTAINMLITQRVKTWSIPTDQLIHLYNETSAGSPLRMLFVEFCTSGSISSNEWKQHSERFPRDMLIDIAISTNKRFDGKPIEPSKYYVRRRIHN